MAQIQKKYKTKLNLKFPVVILEVDLDLDCDGYAKDITSLLNGPHKFQHDTDGPFSSWYTTYHDPVINKLFNQLPGTLELKSKVDKIAIQYADMCGIRRPTNENKMNWTEQYWASKMTKDDEHEFHIHGLSTIAGTFYVKSDENSSPITFQDPAFYRRMHESKGKKEKQYNYERWSYNPKPNKLLLWPAWLDHRVGRNRKETDRISVSFNLDCRA